jgi:hypothetical protein
MVVPCCVVRFRCGARLSDRAVGCASVRRLPFTCRTRTARALPDTMPLYPHQRRKRAVLSRGAEIYAKRRRFQPGWCGQQGHGMAGTGFTRFTEANECAQRLECADSSVLSVKVARQPHPKRRSGARAPGATASLPARELRAGSWSAAVLCRFGSERQRPGALQDASRPGGGALQRTPLRHPRFAESSLRVKDRPVSGVGMSVGTVHES